MLGDSAFAAPASDPDQHPLFNWINQKSGPRPAIGWFSGEEYAYHELKINPEWQLAPEFYPFFDHKAITNRQFEWVSAKGCIAVYTKGAQLQLTGDNAASHWLSEPANQLLSAGTKTTFVAKSGKRCREAAVIPAIQFNVHQHPVWQFEVAEASVPYQLMIAVKGRSGKPLFVSDWTDGPVRKSIQIGSLLKKAGHDLNFAQVHVALVLWKDDLSKEATITFSLTSKTKAAVILPLPYIRTSQTVSHQIPVWLCNDKGVLTPLESTNLFSAQFNQQTVKIDKGMIRLPSLKSGLYQLVVGQTKLIIRIADGNHWYKPDTNEQAAQFWRKAGSNPTTLTGTYASIVHVANPGETTERLIQTEAEYLNLREFDRHYHFWEGLTESEQAARFKFLADKGIDVVHISQGWGFWQKLDNGGKISPFGAEVVARYYRLADQYGIAVVQALTHYQYYRKANKEGWGTPPNEAYFEAGFQDSEWEKVQDGPFQRLFSQYLKDYGMLFKDETAILMLSTSGEGDQKAYAERCTWVEQQMAINCPKTAFYSEPIHIFYKKPLEHLSGWPQKTIGSRTYTMGALIRSDLDLIFYFRLNRTDNRIIMAEGAFPAPGLYSRFNFKSDDQRAESWIGTDYYRLHVRDNLYQGLVMGMPIMLTWEEQFTEDERLCLKQCLNILKEPFIPRKPSIEVLFDQQWYKERAKYYEPILNQYSSLALADFAVVEAFSQDAQLKIDPAVGLQPDQLLQWKSMSKIVLSEGYKATWATNNRGQTLIYLFNSGGQKNHEVLYGRYHRIAKPADLDISFGGTFTAHIWDLQSKSYHTMTGNSYGQKQTSADFLILLNP